VAAAEVLIGSTSYNGQRCTAIKLVMLHESVVDAFFEQFLPRIASLKGGLPWDDGVSITPLPEPNKTQHMKALIADAISKGAKLLNEDTGGGKVKGNLMHPAVVFPVTSDMLLWEEEQVLFIFHFNIFYRRSYLWCI
jgi:glyceraldehyde-3-phosphate dehydrogenase (NADP+)